MINPEMYLSFLENLEIKVKVILKFNLYNKE